MAKPIDPNRLAYSISEFCTLVGISRSFFYTLPETARPRIVHRGCRQFITRDAAEEWLSTEFRNGD